MEFILAAIIGIFIASFGDSVNATLIETLDAALLADILQSYTSHIASTRASCSAATSVSATSSSFDFPGTNLNSNWHAPFVQYEADLFQAIMTHTEGDGTSSRSDGTSNRSWEIRIGKGGNIYSHYTPNMYGETFPPQNNGESPWIDEVQQTVSVNLDLNYQGATLDQYGNKAYFIHQAGAYQRDTAGILSIEEEPFFSPSLAHHCSGNSCMFASWGTQAHVATPFTSPIIYINKYTNCDNGVIEHTQMIHK